MRLLGAVLLTVLCAAASACGGGGQPGRSAEPAIEIFGPYRGTEADRFVESLRPFLRESGLRVRYVGSVDFVEDLRRRVTEDNDPPDLAVVPQPGLVRQLAAEHRIVAPGRDVAAAVAADYPPETAAFGLVDGTLFAVPYRLTVKSLVWYRPDVFARHGWQRPRTLGELEALSARIASGSELRPWCFGMAAGSATGWAATDWVEDLVVRTAGPAVYRRWAAGSVPFRNPEIASAFARFRSLVLAPGRVAGGLAAVVQTPVEDALRPLFVDPPRCAMVKQADFAAAWLPDGTTIGAEGDVSWFPLPGATAADLPIVVGGDQVVQFRRDADVDALLAYLAGPDAGITWARRGGFVSPKSSIPEDAYPVGFHQGLVDALGSASAILFDASDRMPPDVGSGLVWSGITRWVAGVDDYATFARQTDDALASASGAGG